MKLGDKIRLEREEAGLTQKELAKKIGVSYRSIQNYESNKTSPRISILEKIAKVLNLNIDYFKNESPKLTTEEEKKIIFSQNYQHPKDIQRLYPLFESVKEKIDKIKDEDARTTLINSIEELVNQIDQFDKKLVSFKSIFEKENSLWIQEAFTERVKAQFQTSRKISETINTILSTLSITKSED